MSSESGRGKGQVSRPLAGLLLMAALLGSLALATGCGKKGPPEPPLRFVPVPAKDLTVVQQGYRLLLDFSYPKVTPGGQALNGVTAVEVWEVKRPAPTATTPSTPPPGTAPAATPATKPPATSTAAPPAVPAPSSAPATPPPAPAPAKPAPAAPAPGTPPATAPGTPATPAAPSPPAGPPPLHARELKTAALVLKLKGPEVGAATQGDSIVVSLSLPEPLPEKAEMHYFAVRTVGPNGDRSEFSNQAILVPRTPPPPPTETQVKPRADGVEVTWTAPTLPTTTPPLEILGYDVYRRDSQVKGFGSPLHAAAAGDRTFVDTSARFGQSYIYAVTTVLARRPLIESAIKSEVEIKYVDRFPPPVPGEPVALVEAGRIRLVWRASEAPDLAGYRVYRLDLRQVKGEYQRLTETPITDVQFTDSNVTSGVSYVYRITAIDQAGNESEPAEARATAQ